MSTPLQIVCVSHELELYRRHVGGNPHVNRHPICLYDNRLENVGVAARYNHFIETRLPQVGDAWIVFLHHDFSFDEDPAPFLARMPHNAIYGVIGTRLQRGGPYIRLKLFGPDRGLSAGCYQHQQFVGEISCAPEQSASGKMGKAISEPETVDTVDCCCLIVHSALIRKLGLRFDPRLAWHFYSEDFSLEARRRHGVQTKVLPLHSGHYGHGRYDANFHSSRDYLFRKHADQDFSSTCCTSPAVVNPRMSIRHGFYLSLPRLFLGLMRT